MLLPGEALLKIDMLSIKVVSTTKTDLIHIILGLGAYSTLLICCQRESVWCTAEQGIRVN